MKVDYLLKFQNLSQKEKIMLVLLIVGLIVLAFILIDNYNNSDKLTQVEIADKKEIHSQKIKQDIVQKVKKDKLALLGDAAHAVVPFYGQGMNCSFEDCVVLDDCIEQYEDDWHKIFSSYQELRKTNADAIADLALQNFVEMRDLVGHPDFLEKKHVEHELCELYPEVFKSQYELVTFTNEPYRKAMEQGEKNDKVLKTIIDNKIDVNDREKILSIIKEANV